MSICMYVSNDCFAKSTERIKTVFFLKGPECGLIVHLCLGILKIALKTN